MGNINGRLLRTTINPLVILKRLHFVIKSSRHSAASQDVAGSIPDGVTGIFFYWRTLSERIIKTILHSFGVLCSVDWVVGYRCIGTISKQSKKQTPLSLSLSHTHTHTHTHAEFSLRLSQEDTTHIHDGWQRDSIQRFSYIYRQGSASVKGTDLYDRNVPQFLL